MILKVLLVIVVIAVVYFMFIKKKPPVTKSKKETKRKEKPQSNEMVECAECGIYSEIGDSILSNNRYYCSQECLKKS